MASRAPNTEVIAIPSNAVAVAVPFSNTAKLTLSCDQAFTFDFAGPAGGALGASTAVGPIVASTFFEVGVNKGQAGTLFVAIAAGAPASLQVISEP